MNYIYIQIKTAGRGCNTISTVYTFCTLKKDISEGDLNKL